MHVYFPGGLNEAAQKILTAAGRAAEVARSHAAAVDAEGRFPLEAIGALAGEGLYGLCVATEHGGLGQGPAMFAAVVETLAQACASTAMIYVMHVTAAQPIAVSPTLADRAAILRNIAAGNHLTTLAFSERGSRSQFWVPVSQLERRGAGFVTSAMKSWVTSASHADSYVSSGHIAGGAPLESALYLVRKGATGVKVGGRFDGLGLRGNDSTPVTIEGLVVDEGDLVTRPGEGLKGMLEVVLPWFAVGTSAMASGLALAAVGATTHHFGGSSFEHTGERLRDLPTLRARLGEMHVRTAQARATLATALAAMVAPDAETALHVLTARHAALETALAVTDLAMKACGGAAFSRQLGVERAFRDARAGWVMAPTADHLVEFIGRALTGLPLL